MDLTAAIKWLNAAVITNVGHALREPEIVILKGTWRGLTYEQMSNGSEYSTNYLMRDVAPKLWKQLSQVFGRSVGKTNFRVALEAYVATNAEVEPELTTYGLIDTGFTGTQPVEAAEAAASEAGLYWHPAVASDPRRSAGSYPTSTAAASYLPSTDAGYTTGQGFGLMALSGAAMPVPETMYGYVDELERTKQWLSEALPKENTRGGDRTDNLTSSSADNTSEDDSESLLADSLSSSEATGDLPTGHCRLIGIWGLGGVGKTLLAQTLAFQMGDQFESVIWRSLKDKPTLNELSSSVLTSLGIVPVTGQLPTQLLGIMARRSILLILDGIESILQVGTLAGDYQAGYQAYEEFFQSAAGLRSCVVITGTEGPAGLRRQDGYSGYDSSDTRTHAVQSLTLSGLREQAALSLLEDESLSKSDHWPALIARYQGHPLALKAASRVIRAIFNGQVDAFLSQTTVLFTDILRLLAPSFKRLSAPEISILYWLASQDEALSFQSLQRTLPLKLSSAKLVSALDSLKQRSLLEIQTHPGSNETPEDQTDTPAGTTQNSSPNEVSELATTGLPSASPAFYLLPLVKAYAVHQFMDQFSEAGYSAQASPDEAATSSRFYRYADELVSERPEPVINLSAPATEPVHLSRWFKGAFDTNWQTLDQLFSSAARPAMRLRNAYHLRDETFVKRCKSIIFTENNKNSPGETAGESSADERRANQTSQQFAEAFLLVAIHQERENLYKVCVQAQPAQDASVLPTSLDLRLLDAHQTLLANVTAQAEDTFIQLPYFRGASSERFEIQLALGTHTHTETFII